MFKLSVILYVMVFGYVSAYNYKSTIEANIISNGHRCLGNCLSHDGADTCTDTYSGHESKCVNISQPTLRYRTIDGVECSSNCENFENYDYQWCVTEKGGSVSWGKCTRRVATTAIETLLVDKYLACTSECALRPDQEGYWCNTAKGVKSCPSEEEVLLVKHYTKDFKLCSGPCEDYKGNPYCYDENGDWEQCYLNPDVSNILSKLNEYIHKEWQFGEYTKNGYHLCKQRRKRQPLYRFIWPMSPQTVESIANNYEILCPSVPVNDPNNPVYSYTVRQMRGNINLPLVIRARITSSHLRRPGQRPAITTAARNHVASMDQITGQPSNNDECGHILASMLGGPTDAYNFFPQSVIHNRGSMSRWYYLENAIYNYLNGQPNRHVEWIAVLSYDFTDPFRPFRPTAIALTLREYSGVTRTSGESLENMFFTNVPDATQICILDGGDGDDLN